MILRCRYRHRNAMIGKLLAAAAIGAAGCIIHKLFTFKEDNKCHYESEEIKIVESARKALINKIGVTNSEIEEAKLLNLTAYDLAKDKGFSEDQLKMFINHDRFIAIDELVLNRKISREIGEQVKQKIKEHTDSWSGKLC
ncbi:hypothetical protein M2651_00470 [Clostridium sp. SYSU_GA19001]|uniref:hypothetical protein n=1 Tax=Clostridium caldaquaticum TaxID=2940653 RepID=UPI00207786FC|nr:hypothetical protein [Clostridium caldaquaticum]MCM8709495.1 hypothetical protein [Clostridium caldaquaticum]